MKYTKSPKSVSQILLGFVAVTSVVMVTSSCSDSAPNQQIPEQSDPVAVDSITPGTGTGTPESLLEIPDADLPLPDANSPDKQYPEDSENDDRPGMIVSGFSAGDVQTQASQFLLSTSAFRLARKTPGTGDSYVHMQQYDEAMPVATHIDFYQPPIDNCLIRNPDDAGATEDRSLNTSDSGGTSVVINSPSGPWFTFERTEGELGQFHYEIDNGLPGRLPEQASLSVPGDVFPTVSAYPIFEPEPLVRLLPIQEQALSANSEFTWVAGPDSGHVKINLLAYDDSDVFAGFLVTCWVEDNGAFEMPTAVTELISSSERTLTVRYSRVYARIDWLNGVLMYQHIEVAE